MDSVDNAELAKQIGQAVAKYRKLAGLSQAQVAELMGLSNDAISRMERGTIVLNVPRLFEFAQLFNCDVSDLLSATSQDINKQAQYLAQLLQKLNESERTKLLSLIEQMIEWKQAE